MKYNKIVIFAILTIFLFCIAGACASDAADDAVASEDGGIVLTTENNVKTIEDEQTINTTNNEDTLSLSESDEFVSAENDLDVLSATQSTYSGLSSEIGSGGNIKLSYDYYTYDNGDAIEITVDDSVIDGNGAIIDMLGSNIQTFIVSASNVTIKNLNIINANAQKSGAAIFFNKTGFVENCNFTNNTASGSFNGGGAICFNDTANVINCNFVNNTASGLVNGGGAIFYINGAGNVINCNFTGNVASGTLNRGGAINWIGDNCNVSGCRFVNNFAESGSGAISWGGINGNLSDCVFVNNSGTSYDGGAVFFSENGYVTDCIFVNNSVHRNGGALYFYDKGNVTNCNFTDNSADNHGGAIFFFANGDVTNCNFTDNSAAKNGGAVCFYEDGDVTNCIFADNSAANGDGGAIIFYEDGGVVSNCNFTNCSSAEYGGAIFFNGNGAVSDSNFAICSAVEFGGAVCFFVNGDVSNCNFTNNQAPTAGGVFFYRNGDVTNSNFIDNSAGTAGAVYLRENGEISNSNFTDNSADTAGAVYLRGDSEISNSNFINNSAETAGAVYIREGGKLSTSNFTNNTAMNYGGAVYIKEGDAVTNCNFVNNKATATNSSGGAVYFNSDGNVVNCIFINNTASSQGGAVYFYEDGTVENCNFANNKVTATNSSGGAAHIGIYGEITNCNFTDNIANNGSAIWSHTGFAENCSFTNNSASYGAVYFNWGGDVIKCNFTNNIASVDGGAVWLPFGNVKNSNFIDNKATSMGGAICWDGNEGNVTDCSFVNNAGRDGGALYWNGHHRNDFQYGIVSGCSFVNNSVTYQGGAIFWNITNVVVSDCSFENNYAPEGGALFWNTINDGTVSDCSFVNNSANHGGAIFCDSCVDAIVSDCSFENNNAQVGGAICWWSTNEALVSGCSFVNNYAKYYGTAIHWDESADGVVSGCSFVNNTGDNGVIYFNNENYGSNLTINDNIFLNNDGVAIYFVKSDSTSNADYNWFGNNATNYDIEPINTNVEIGTWLFLNATANPDRTTVFDSSDILFKLYAYTPDEVSEYDNSRLKAVNLTITPTNGRVNTTRTGLDESVRYTAEVVGIGMITASIEDVSYTISLPISDGTTFFDLNKTINGNDNDTIVLDKDYTYNSTFDYDLNDGIVINRSMTIIGNDHILNATGLARIFDIQADDVTIENITFVNAKVSLDGGAIYWNGANGNLSDCIFENNTARVAGAIYWNGDNGNVSDCDFVNNLATYAAAIYCDGISVVVCDCDFVNNSAYSSGAIDWMAREGVVSGCSFVNNSAESTGGAIYWTGADSKVSDCIFVNNNAEKGGAIVWDGLSGAVSGCIFVNNSADNAGAIRWHNNDGGVVSGCSFVNNSAGDSIIYFANMYYGTNLLINDNVFLNNDGVAIYFEKIESSSNADYNWFGNNATNYDIEPITHNAGITAWLFLNATADPASILISETSDIIFKLYSYGPSGVSDYDSSKLPIVNLTVTATNGDVDAIAGLGETIKYTATNSGTGSVTAKIENAEYTIEINNIRLNPNLSVEPQEVTYSNKTVIALNYDSSVTGKVNVTLNGKKSEQAFKNLDLNATISLGDIGADEYDIIVEYSGNDIFSNATATGTLKVNKANSTLTVNNIKFDYKGSGSSEISFTGATGVDAEVANQPDAFVNVSENAITVSNLNVGKYTLIVTTIPDENHNAVTETAAITVNKIIPNITVSADNINYGEDLVVKVTSDDDLAYRVNVTVGDQSKLLRLKEGKRSLKFSDLAPGSYTVTAVYKGDPNYSSVSVDTTVVVKPIANLSISVSAGGNGVVVVDVTSEDNLAYRVNVTVGDQSKLLRLKDGKGTLKFTDLEDGTYTVVALYKGDADYAAFSVNASVEVKNMIPNLTVSASAGGNGIVVVNVTCEDSLANRVNVTVGNQSKLLRLKDGKGTLKFDGLDDGTYSVVALYKGDSDYVPVEANTSVEVNGIIPNLTVSASADDNGIVIVNVTCDVDLANRVNVTVGDQSMLLRLKEGEGTLKFDGLEAGTYDVVVSYKGDSNFKPSSNSTTVVVD